jgi:hypothetical protein
VETIIGLGSGGRRRRKSREEASEEDRGGGWEGMGFMSRQVKTASEVTISRYVWS